LTLVLNLHGKPKPFPPWPHTKAPYRPQFSPSKNLYSLTENENEPLDLSNKSITPAPTCPPFLTTSAAPIAKLMDVIIKNNRSDEALQGTSQSSRVVETIRRDLGRIQSRTISRSNPHPTPSRAEKMKNIFEIDGVSVCFWCGIKGHWTFTCKSPHLAYTRGQRTPCNTCKADVIFCMPWTHAPSCQFFESEEALKRRNKKMKRQRDRRNKRERRNNNAQH